MPASARKSSLGASGAVGRRANKPYVPFRADERGVGKRTGQYVPYIEHHSDEFEPFSEVLNQAKTPPNNVKSRRGRGGGASGGRSGRGGRGGGRGGGQGSAKGKGRARAVVSEDEDDGEMSMELDDSPVVNYTNARNPQPPSSISRLGNSSSRSLPRPSDGTDYDSLPSPPSMPRFRNSQQTPTGSGRRSSIFPNGSASAAGASVVSSFSSPGVNNMSYSAAMPEMDPDEDMYGTGMGGFNDGGFSDDDDDDDNTEQFESFDPDKSSKSARSRQSMGGQSGVSASVGPSTTSSRRTSFSQMGQEDDENEGDEEEGQEEEQSQEDDQEDQAEAEARALAQANKSKNKGKRRATIEEIEQQQDDGVEDEIEQGLQDVEMDPGFDDDVQEQEDIPEPEPQPKRKRKKEMERGEEVDVTNAGRKRGRPHKREVHALPDEPEADESGLRRGTRRRYAPLDWWRLEKVVYGRRDSGVTLVPTIKDIIRIPKEPPQPLSKAGRKRGGSTRAKSKTADGGEVVTVWNPEEGWDDETEQNGIVLEWGSGVPVQRRLAYTATMIKPKPALNNDFYFQKVFGDGEYIAAGQLMIPPGGHKPSKTTKDNTYVFYIIEGAVNFKVHDSSYVLATGGMILVPRGNNYYIENICERDARLFFAQARKVAAEEGDTDRAVSAPISVSGLRARSKSNEGEREGTREAGGAGGKKKRAASKV
ncbi:uncharacterized protein STEHIDRAFT_166024 [Stereum hirsutum FP-91666 SS1]|uniref:uncharacterized protein n=1 Tax=Stereum hirsutum (strain FP-91666) TaxID=721885 RepID=UPI000440A27B|nr:uncharacterized protein STEHIDRAFT_166024 [Stereum hirsutum FP-91666 SS1]EIM89667.1 hypothetical protein STEHIDRAFT_166024 [Stereum hirsutum FP-91666 SS1]